MTFINEYIPKEDLEKFNFAELNKRIKKGGGTADDWTIDREADIWLRKFYTESDHTELDGGYTGISVWDYYWKGCLMIVEIKTLETGGGRGKHCWARRRLLSINIPHELESQRPQILKDLEIAFTAYKDGGVFSSSTSFSFALEI
ncbi:hypothetical protein [Methylocucumis oryzae]|uniref:Uncharacterized protein n=1 Tax=Methylocucumis oryzae TaxID=1632867 RepID=A0A0F3IFH1_9GAMM|nr:hypothetical protein [Methylocucumis oryzae]KJV05283.1 hypothetical protein VZ94_19290 [Methylocucumis oryzae]